MCLFPRKIVTPFNRLSPHGGQPLILSCRCGRCAQCKKEQQNEWKFRTYYEALSCLSKLGFVYYVTLTYSPQYLPKLSHFYDLENTNIQDFSCFNHEHFKLFLKRLRSRLEYGYRGTIFRYFLTSEYGVDDRYTHRPHHHLLFFVYDPKLDALTFSQLVSECWLYGRTDGIPYKTRDEVLENVFTTCDKYSLLRVSNYISKYIAKDSDFQRELDNRISILRKYVNDEEELKKLIRNISLFHRQSKGFGVYYLEILSDKDREFIHETSTCRLSDIDKVVDVIKLPLYYKRKLYYTLNKKDDGTYYWIPTDIGVEFIKKQQINNIRKTVNSYHTSISNLSDYDKDRVQQLLGTRTLEDLAVYNLYYKGYSRSLRDIGITSFLNNDNMTDEEYNLYDWLDNIVKSKFINQSEEEYYPVDREKKTIEYIVQTDLFSIETKTYEYDKVLRFATFNQNSSSAFRRFDEINAILDSNNIIDARETQKTYDYTIMLQKRYKQLFNKDKDNYVYNY